jgi:hypothetical protein
MDGLHWYLSGPKAERHFRYIITASSNQIKEKLEQECSNAAKKSKKYPKATLVVAAVQTQNFSIACV